MGWLRRRGEVVDLGPAIYENINTGERGIEYRVIHHHRDWTIDSEMGIGVNPVEALLDLYQKMRKNDRLGVLERGIDGTVSYG